MADRAFAAEIERGVLADMERAHEIRLEEWQRRPWLERVKERLAMGLIQQY